MTSGELLKLRYPIGRFAAPKSRKPDDIDGWIRDIAVIPGLIRNELEDLSAGEEQLTYKPNGWNIHQVVNHLVDSHMNSLIRFKWTLTEKHPTIKPYKEHAWASLADYDRPLEETVDILDLLHRRWVTLLQSLSKRDLKKAYFHPGSKRNVPLDINIALYAWHGKHHLGHIRLAKNKR